MKVDEEIMYHFHRTNEWDFCWQQGNEIEFNNGTKNSFSSFYDNHASYFVINNAGYYPKIAAKEMKRLLPYCERNDIYNYIDFTLNVFQECGIYIREQIFEEIRQKINCNLPSRKSCLWVFRENSKKHWHEEIGSNSKLFKLKISGELFIADQEYLYNEITEHDKIIKNAYAYWSGASGNDPEHEECLFIGKARIIDCIE
jgi:hypothetical protein